MFKFSKQLIEQFRNKYFDKYGIGLTSEQAEEYLHSLADLFSFIIENKAVPYSPKGYGQLPKLYLINSILNEKPDGYK